MVVGYDRPLAAFFATEDVIAWLWETVSLKKLRAFFAPYAAVGDDVLRELADERVNRATHPMQKLVDHRWGGWVPIVRAETMSRPRCSSVERGCGRGPRARGDRTAVRPHRAWRGMNRDEPVGPIAERIGNGR